MEGVAEGGRLKGDLEGWVGSNSERQSGTPQAEVLRPESSGTRGMAPSSGMQCRAGAALGAVQRGCTWSKPSSICWEHTVYRL